MSVTPGDVAHIASLARLRLGPGEADRLTAEMNAILAHVDALAAVDDVPEADADDPGGRPPGTSPVAPEAAPERSPGGVPVDRLTRSLEDTAPAWRDGFFVVPLLPALDGSEPAERPVAPPAGEGDGP